MSLTAEQKSFLAEVAPGRFWMEIDALFEERFGFALGKNKVHYTLSRMGVKSGVEGREPGCETPMSEKYQIGDERVHKRDVWVKVAKGCCTKENKSIYKSGLWRKKAELVWEEANGEPFPQGHVVMFADNDRRNFDPANLVAVPTDVSQVVYGMKLPHHDRASLETCVAIARIRVALRGKRDSAGIGHGK